MSEHTEGVLQVGEEEGEEEEEEKEEEEDGSWQSDSVSQSDKVGSN